MGATRGGAEGTGSAAKASKPVHSPVEIPVKKTAKYKGTKGCHNLKSSVGQQLFATESQFHRAEFLSMDPLEFVLRFSDPWDQEVVALLSALLAYGNVKQIRRSIEEVLRRIGPSPARRLEEVGQDRAAWESILKGFVHRFTLGVDLAHLLTRVAGTRASHGSLGAFFLQNGIQNRAEATTRMTEWFSAYGTDVPAGRERNLKFLLAHPSSGSACKRFCMFLRWMGRRDQIDPGLWQTGSPLLGGARGLSPAALILPLDTHLLRISRKLGLTRSKVASWKAALEATAALEAFDPEDPVRFDFALCRLGMLGHA